MHFAMNNNSITLKYYRESDSKELSINIRNGKLDAVRPYTVCETTQTEVCVFGNKDSSVPLEICYPMTDKETAELTTRFLNGEKRILLDRISNPSPTIRIDLPNCDDCPAKKDCPSQEHGDVHCLNHISAQE